MIDGTQASAPAGATPTQQRANPKGQLDKDAFLKLFIVQIQNQDPFAPMDADQMATQMAQFTSVEKLNSIEMLLQTQIEGQGNMMATLNGNAAMNMVGKTILAQGDAVEIVTGAESVPVQVGGTGGRGTLKIYDANGAQVGQRDLGSLVAGRQDIALGTAARDLPAGAYTYKVEVVDGGGNPVHVEKYTRARVDGVRYGAEGPVLTSGRLTIPFGAIFEIATA